MALPCILTPKRTEFGKRVRKDYEAKLANYKRSDMTELTPRQDGKSNTITTVQKDNLLADQELLGYSRDKQGKVTDRHSVDLANTIHGSTGHGGNTDQFVKKKNYRLRIRKLTEREVFRLMDVDEKFIDKMMASGVSRSRLYFAAGNSIVVACMEHIFENLFFPTHECSVDENGQLSLF